MISVFTFASEQALEDALNFATITGKFGILAKGGKFTLAITDGEGQIISPEAQEVLDNMPTPLAGSEEQAVIDFVNSQSVSLGSSNWNLIDAFAHGKLSNNTNKLHKWIANSLMVNNGAILGANGWEFNGTTAFIDSGYNPFVDGVNYQLDDALVGAFVVESLNTLNAGRVFGSSLTNGTFLRDEAANLRRRIAVNAGNVIASVSGEVQDNSLYIINRIDAVNVQSYINGLLSQTLALSSIGIANGNLFIGSDGSDEWPGTLSSFIAGAAIGFDQLDFFNNLEILNAAL